MNEPINIPKNVSTKDDLDFEYLYKEGIAYLEKFGSKLWTDYNTHDPGVTILDMVCYAITDLSQRIEMPIQNLLASEEDNFAKMHEQFLSAVNILPSKPVTALDYRKLFVHLKDVKNAWIVKHPQKVYMQCEDGAMSYTPFEDLELGEQTCFDLKGLNDIYIDFEEDVEDEEAVLENVRSIYRANRNLCEDIVNVCKIPEQSIGVCAYIDLYPDADEELIQAKINRALQHYFAPSVRFYSLQEMYDRAYTTDQIFEGPVPFPGACVALEEYQGGFVDPEELRKADLRREVRKSDIIQLIMNIEGVKLIKDVSIGNCSEEGDFDPKNWILCVKENHKPILCENSIFSYTKGLLPIGINQERVAELEARIKQEEKDALAVIETEDVAFPLGRFSDAGSFTTIQNDFPQAYGISPVGLSNSVPKSRKAKAKQLKGYLLFFDQVLANYFSHLASVKDFLSVDETLKKLYTVEAIEQLSDEDRQIYHSQGVEDITDFDQIVDLGSYPNSMIGISNSLKTDETQNEFEVFYQKRNQLLDHLIARFAERFNEYVFVMKTLYGERANTEVLKAKARFVQDYKSLSCERGHGYNYCGEEVWDTDNVAGVQKRITRLTGVEDYTRRNLLPDYLEIYEENDDDGILEYRWRIKEGNDILISSSKHYHSFADAYTEMQLGFILAQDADNYDLKETEDGAHTYFNLINPEVTDQSHEDWIVARQIAFTNSQEDSELQRDHIVTYLSNLDFEIEGMYMIEHVLLRPDLENSDALHPEKTETVTPDAPSTNFMAPCVEDGCKSCGPEDPYSFRVTILLPGWTHRFGNKNFRDYMEKVIREELPAHVLAKICWIGNIRGMVPDEENDILVVQEKYKTFLQQLKKRCEQGFASETELTDYRTAVTELKECLYDMNTIYGQGRLHDCDNDETETEGNKIILGRTNIGKILNE